MGLWTRLRLNRQPDGTSAWVWIVLLALGITLVLFGYFWEGTWEDVFIEVGAAAGVGGVVLFFKPRLMQQVREQAKDEAATTAAAIVTTATEELTSRVVRLENIGDVQANVEERLQREAESVIADVAAEVSQPNIESQLIIASEQGLFADRILVKTNVRPGHPLIMVERDTTFNEPGSGIYLAIWRVSLYDDGSESFGEMDDSDMEWQPNDDTSSIIQQIILKYKQLGLPKDDLSTELLFDHLQHSYRLMVAAHHEPKGSANRIDGKLIFLINDEWVLTDTGLEGTKSSRVFRWGREYGPDIHIIFDRDHSCPQGYQESLWKEAVYYATRLDEFAP